MSTECLKKDTLLKNRYRILKKLGQGGFGATYLAVDAEIEQNVVVKECFPIYLAERETESGCLQVKDSSQQSVFEKEIAKFLDEARRMAKLQHISEIAKVLGYFREKNTAYIVMEYVKGTNLRTFMECQDEPFTFQGAADFLMPVIRALGEVHKKGLIHRDLTPDNILVREDKSLKIIDFGSSREFVDEKTKTILVKSGYAPLEQYSGKEKQGPWTDVYGICAVLYEMVTGAAPQDSLSRMESDELYPPSMYGAEVSEEEEVILMKGLAQDYQQRYQDMKKLENAIREVTGGKDSRGENAESEKYGLENKKSIWRKALLVAGAIGLMSILGAAVIHTAAVNQGWISTENNSNYLESEKKDYAGNYARGSEKYQEYVDFVEENAISHEESEEENYFVLSEAAVLEWGEPCNQMHFSYTVEEWLSRMEGYGRNLQLMEEDEQSEDSDDHGYYEVTIEKYGAVITNFRKEVVYAWEDQMYVQIFYDPVDEKIVALLIWNQLTEEEETEKAESGDDAEYVGIVDEKISFVADCVIAITNYVNYEKEDIDESIKAGTEMRQEYEADTYLAQGYMDVRVNFCKDQTDEDDFYYWCLPDEQMSFAMYHSYYWP